MRQQFCAAALDLHPGKQRRITICRSQQCDVGDIPYALHFLYQQRNVLVIANLLAFIVQTNACRFMRSDILSHFAAKDESADKRRTKAAINPEKLPSSSASESYTNHGTLHFASPSLLAVSA